MSRQTSAGRTWSLLVAGGTLLFFGVTGGIAVNRALVQDRMEPIAGDPADPEEQNIHFLGGFLEDVRLSEIDGVAQPFVADLAVDYLCFTITNKDLSADAREFAMAGAVQAVQDNLTLTEGQAFELRDAIAQVYATDADQRLVDLAGEFVEQIDQLLD